ncbi:CYFA0S25e00672g1_1 [Cyberlindnera fabianii]|uniref:CYFA0S25e00672g1_1 n=1 Tax=Cyberlindnera fabianii TaxID=36022 RepID=A0A061B9P9_CYBFA|nr:CYFA0S25e00672g1_1 [Cyberlindnera fabianii]
MLTRAQQLEENHELVLETIATNDVVILPGFSTAIIVDFLKRVQETRLVLVSDELTLDEDQQSLSLKYHSFIHALSQSNDFKQFEFIILDGVDDRSTPSDLCLSILQKSKSISIKPKSKIIIPLKSHFKMEFYRDYLSNSFENTTIVDIIPSPEIEIYHTTNTSSTKLISGMIDTLQRLWSTDNTNEPYDVLLLMATKDDVMALNQAILNHLTMRDFSIITDLDSYTNRGSTMQKRVLISTSSSPLVPIVHKVKHIIDSGLIEITRFDPHGFQRLDVVPTNNNRINQNMSIMQSKGSKYFVMSPLKDLEDFGYMGFDTNNYIIPFIVQCIKFQIRFEDLLFLKPPSSDTMEFAIDNLLYLKLIKITDKQSYEFTNLARILGSFDFPYDPLFFMLYTSLTIAIESSNCIEQMCDLISLIHQVGTHTLSSYLKDQMFDKDQVVPTSDILSLLNVVERFKRSNKQHTRRSPISIATQKRVLLASRELMSRLPQSTKQADDESIEECLIQGCQSALGVIKREIDADTGNIKISIIPVQTSLDNNMDFILRRDIKSASVFQDGDLVIMLGHSLDRSVKKRQRCYIDLVSKVNPSMALKLIKTIKTI